MFSFNAVAVSSSSHYLDSSLQRISQASAKIGTSQRTIDAGGISLSVKLNTQAAKLMVKNGNIQNAILSLEA